jgi:hypothetical protein
VKWRDTPASLADVRRGLSELRAKGVPPGIPASARVHHAVFIPGKPRGPVPDDIDVIDARAVLSALR